MRTLGDPPPPSLDFVYFKAYAVIPRVLHENVGATARHRTSLPTRSRARPVSVLNWPHLIIWLLVTIRFCSRPVTLSTQDMEEDIFWH